jgi:transcription elongation factor GreA
MVKNAKQPIIQLTTTGLKSLQGELSELKNVKRPQIVERVAYARDQGDLSENSAYIQGKEELNFIDGRISELEEIVNQAKIVDTSKTDNHKVEIGNKVTLKMYNKDGEHTFHVVGEWEADPKQKKISHESPLGKALIGKQKGDIIEVEAPAGTIKYTIIKIQ